jgi:succinate dehydrogenase hydrophobic anchor subunit
MGWKDSFTQCNKAKQNEQKSPLLLAFNLAAGATVLLPLIMWMIAFFVRNVEAKAAEEDGEGAALGFVYIWSLLVFCCIVWHGNQVLGRDSKELLKVFLASLVFFSNLAFLLSVLTGRLGVSANVSPITWRRVIALL